jgi:hypothetical protein
MDEDRSKNGCLELPELSMEGWKKGLCIAVGPTFPP